MLNQIFIHEPDLKNKIQNWQATPSRINNKRKPAGYIRSLIEANRDSLIIINLEGEIIDLNTSFLAITGLSREKLTESYLSDYFTDRHKANDLQEEVLITGYVTDVPLDLQRNDGTIISVLYSGSVFIEENGSNSSIIVVLRDITKQKRRDQELIALKYKAEQANIKAEESSKLKESFLANMSHEIRTPLNAIIGFSDILMSKNIEREEKEQIKTIKSAGENLLNIINDILDISKIETGLMTFEEKPFGIQEVFRCMEEELSGRAADKNLSITFSIDESVPTSIIGDQTRLTQILLNLAGNAIKFTATGSVKLSCTRLKSQSPDIILEFSIQDTGIGIPQEKLHFIFEQFRQVESHTTRKYGGSGLGLSIAKQLVELQGGRLSVRSELNVGSVFSFCIPYKKTNHESKLVPIQENPYCLEGLRKLKILLIEDNRLNVMLISSLFTENKLQLDVASNGQEGVEKLECNKYHLVLMDMEMPVMNGYEAATVIRKKLKSNIPIIAMTAHAMSGEKENCLSLGMNDYIAKPISANTLFQKMHVLTQVICRSL